MRWEFGRASEYHRSFGLIPMPQNPSNSQAVHCGEGGQYD
jgi:hypothetical protein